MSACTTEGLGRKIVIRVCDGKKLGHICNYEIDSCEGKISAIFVPSEDSRRLFSRTPEFRIPWCKIEKIGEDTVFVDVPPGIGECSCAHPQKKHKWFFQ